MRSCVCSFVRLFVRSFVSFVFFHLLLFCLCLSLGIVANIVRHSPKKAVHNLEQHVKEVPSVMKIVPRRGRGPPFGVPGGVWTSLLGFFRSHVAPQWLPGRFLEDFGRQFGVILKPKSLKVGVDFRCVFGLFC